MRDARKIDSFDFLENSYAIYNNKIFYYYCTWVVDSKKSLYITLIKDGRQVNFPSKEAIKLILDTKYNAIS
jgi:hypothetical protein